MFFHCFIFPLLLFSWCLLQLTLVLVCSNFLLIFNDYLNTSGLKREKLQQTNVSNVFVSKVVFSSWLDFWDTKPPVQNCHYHRNSSSEMRICYLCLQEVLKKWAGYVLLNVEFRLSEILYCPLLFIQDCVSVSYCTCICVVFFHYSLNIHIQNYANVLDTIYFVQILSQIFICMTSVQKQ